MTKTYFHLHFFSNQEKVIFFVFILFIQYTYKIKFNYIVVITVPFCKKNYRTNLFSKTHHFLKFFIIIEITIHFLQSTKLQCNFRERNGFYISTTEIIQAIILPAALPKVVNFSPQFFLIHIHGQLACFYLYKTTNSKIRRALFSFRRHFPPIHRHLRTQTIPVP